MALSCPPDGISMHVIFSGSMERDDTCCNFIASSTAMGKRISFTMFMLLPCSRKEAGTALTNIVHETDKKKVLQNLMKSLERLSVSFRSWH